MLTLPTSLIASFPQAFFPYPTPRKKARCDRLLYKELWAHTSNVRAMSINDRIHTVLKKCKQIDRIKYLDPVGISKVYFAST